MPLLYDILKSQRLVLVVGVSPVTYSDVLRHYARVAEDARYEAPMQKLVWLKDRDTTAMSPDESTALMRRKRQFDEAFQGERCAVVVSSDLDYGITRMQEAYCEDCGQHLQAFRDFDEAITWLELNREDSHVSTWLRQTDERLTQSARAAVDKIVAPPGPATDKPAVRPSLRRRSKLR